MVDVITEIIIDRPREIVARYTSDPENAPHWYVNIDSAVWVTPPPLRIGSQIDFKARFLGKNLSYTYEVVEMSDACFVMRTAQGPFPMETTYEWEPIDKDKTLMRLRNRGKPSGFSKLMAPFMAKMMRKANIKDLEKLKTILEDR